MFNIRLVNILNSKEARFQIERIGSDRGGVAAMFRKAKTINLKIHNLKVPQAHILKQEMLAIGGDAAVAREVLVGAVERSDVLVMGTVKQLYELCRRLVLQPFSMKKLSYEIKEILANIEKDEFTWKVRDKEIVLGKKTLIMGILNVTPDSFSDGGLYQNTQNAVMHALEMIDDGADIIDIGGESTRPYAEFVSSDEEKRRIIPVIEELRKRDKDILISVDTYKAETAQEALNAGADIINDISGLTFDEKMKDVVSKYKAGLIIMHTRGKPSEMQKNTDYEDFMEELLATLSSSINKAKEAGVEHENIVIDPGIGFGKGFDHNLFILKNLKEFSIFGLPILIGASRKSFIGKIVDKEAPFRDDATQAATAIAILNGCHIVRVHDVKKTKDAVLVADAIKHAVNF